MNELRIGLNGKKGSGKDTAADYLAKNYGFIKKSFAGLLKESAAAIFEIPVESWEKIKNDPTAVISLDTGSELHDMTIRVFLQRYGTEAHRDVFGSDFWIRALQNDLPTNMPWVITDARFENELAAVRQKGGVTVQILRPGSDESDAHASEAPVDEGMLDFIIENDGNKGDLYTALDYLVGRMKNGGMA